MISNFLDMQFHLLHIRRESDRPTRLVKVTSRPDTTPPHTTIIRSYSGLRRTREKAQKKAKIRRQNARSKNERTDRTREVKLNALVNVRYTFLFFLSPRPFQIM